ncbi:MAG: site-specific integrase [Bacteriovoracaceae bacterium]|jgi:integrase|nr:site-specific integrase [Bacteriovoracaceae bacterium]
MPIYEQKKGKQTTYMVVATAKINGKQYYKKRRGISSIAKAKRVEIELKLILEQMKHNPVRYTLRTWSSECIKRMELQYKKSTTMGYTGSFNKWILPLLGDYYLNEITSTMVHRLIFEHIQGISLHAKQSILKHLKRVFEMAIDEGLVTKNPAKVIKLKVPEANNLVFNKTEIDNLLFEAKKRSHPYYNHWVMALMTGMRNGELYALNWTDIDFENKVISVTKSWSRTDGLGPTKSTRNRYIPISQELNFFLRDLKSKNINNSENILEKLPSWTNGEQAKVLRDFCDEIGITSIRFHDIRATFITQMLIKGVALAKVMKIVGHASIKTTMKYLRLVAQDTQGATESLGISLPQDFNHDNVVNLFQH